MRKPHFEKRLPPRPRGEKRNWPVCSITYCKKLAKFFDESGNGFCRKCHRGFIKMFEEMEGSENVHESQSV